MSSSRIILGLGKKLKIENKLGLKKISVNSLNKKIYNGFCAPKLGQEGI
jgi:hypothetical protein